MTLFLTLQGFAYVDNYNGGYENADSLQSLVTTGANSIETAFEYGIDPQNDTVYADTNYTDSLTAIGATIKAAVGDGLSVMVRPLIDFLNPSYLTGTPYGVDDWRTYFNPGAAGSAGANAFFASYETMLLQYAQVGAANGATSLCIGTELDQITGPAYKGYWDNIISTLRADYPTLKLTYAADWDDDLSPWKWGGSGLAAGTGNLATQVSFASELDYFGIDNYAPISDAANPTLAQLIAGWTQTPTDATSLAVTGGQSLISYFESVAAAVGKPLIFTELGYESASDAASSPAGSSTDVYDPALQSLLYQAFFEAWQQSGDTSLTGVYFWNWDPNAAEVGPGNGANFSPQDEPALTEVTQAFSSSDKLDLSQVFGPQSTLEIDITTSGSVVKVFNNVSGGETLVDIPGVQISASQILTGETDTPYVLDLAAGAVGDALTISAGGVLNGPGGLIGHSTVAGKVIGVSVGDPTDFGELELLSGGVASKVTASGAGDYIQVDSGASATGTVLTSSGYAVVFGSTTSTTVSGAAGEIVSSGGKATSTTVLSGGTETLLSGAIGDAITVSAGGALSGPGTLAGANYIHGAATGVAVASGAVEYVLASGTATGTVVSDGGYQLVSSGGVVGGTAVLSGGRQYVYSAGLASAATVSAGGVEEVLAAGSARGTVLSSGGEQRISSGGDASATTILGGGKDAIYAGGSAVDATVSSGGLAYVLASGTTTETVVNSGGKELISSGGIASETQVQSGGRAYIYSGGAAMGPTISNGGAEAIYAGGTASGLGLLSGGDLIDDGEVLISGAGTLAGILAGSGTVIETGGGDLVFSGADAKFSGKAVISGGTIELATSGALGRGYVEFVAPSTGSAGLQIDAANAPAAGGTFANTIYDFSGAGEDIDLRSIAFVSGASATVSGTTLTLTDGGKTYKFTLGGRIGGAYPVLSDGHGGTLIDPTVARFAQAAAAFAPSNAAKTALVSSGSPAGQTPFLHATVSAGAGHP